MKAILDFGNNEGQKTFKSKDEITNFLSQEMKFWQTFLPRNQNFNVISVIQSDLTNQYNSAIQIVSRITDDSNFQNFVNQISQQYKNNRLLRYDGKRAKYAQSIAEKDSILSMYLIGYFTNKLYQYTNDSMAFKAIFEGMKFDNGITSNIDSEKESLNHLKNDWDNTLDSLRTQFETLNSISNQTQHNIDQYYIDLQKQFNDFKIQKESEFQTVIETYDKKLALQAPVDYWSNRSFWNYITAGILGVIFFISVCIIIANFEPTAKDVALGITNKDYYPLIQFGSIALIAIWLLRIIVKIFYSKLHLAEEAKEKEMFIKTYLSMLRESEGIKDESDRHLILQSIFSPSKNGIIQDDGLPMNVIENIVKANK